MTTISYNRYFILAIINRQTGQEVYLGQVKSSGSVTNYSNIGGCFIQALFQQFPGGNNNDHAGINAHKHLVIIDGWKCIKEPPPNNGSNFAW